MKIIITGRTATGKHYLADLLGKNGFVIATSYTTDKNTPVGYGYPLVITDADAAAVPDAEKFFLQSADGTVTYMLQSDLENANILLLHPHDVPEAIKRIGMEAVSIMNMTCGDAAKQAVMDTQNPNKTGKSLSDRQVEENPAYSKYEQELASEKSTFGAEFIGIWSIVNDYDPNTLYGVVLMIQSMMNGRKNMTDIINENVRLGLIDTDGNGNILVYYPNEKKGTPISIDQFISFLTDKRNEASYAYVLQTWLNYATDPTLGTRINAKIQNANALNTVLQPDANLWGMMVDKLENAAELGKKAEESGNTDMWKLMLREVNDALTIGRASIEPAPIEEPNEPAPEAQTAPIA